MAKTTKSTYKPRKTANYKSVRKMADGGNVSEMNYSERKEYIQKHYAPLIKDAQMIFSIYGDYFEYDYKADRNKVVEEIISHYQSLGDYTEATLPQETIYEIQDWDLVRRDIDPETDEVIDEIQLETLSADNTYNFSYLGLVDLNWRVYYDADYERYFYVIHPHIGGDIRGNYGDAIILEGTDKDDLFYRFYEGFISGGASIYIKFADDSEVAFDSEQDSDVFNFRLNESFEPTGIAENFASDFEKFDSWYGDEFLEETIDIYLDKKGVAPKMMAGGTANDDSPKAYIQILGYDEGKWIDLSEFSDGSEVIDYIQEWMDELNENYGGNREEYEVSDYEGFGNSLYDIYMGKNEFDEILEAYEKFNENNFPYEVIEEFQKDSGYSNYSLLDVIEKMENNFVNKYKNLSDFGYEMVQEGIYTPSIDDVYITSTDKRLIAGEEADNIVNDMSFDELLNIAKDTKNDYLSYQKKLENEISELQSDIDSLTEYQSDITDDIEYEKVADEIEEKELELSDIQDNLDDLENRYEDRAREEANSIIYNEIKLKLENDLEGWLSDYGYDTDDLSELSFLSIDYEKIGEENENDYLIIEFDRELYAFYNYGKGGRLSAKKKESNYKYFIVESNTKKLVSGYETKEEANQQRQLLVKEYPSMRFEIFTLSNLEKNTDLDIYSKKDYVELSTLDKLKKVSVDAYRYGEEKVGQANAFLQKHDVKGKFKRGASKVWDKTKQGGNWLKRQWQEADFGDGKGKAKFFSDGGGVEPKVRGGIKYVQGQDLEWLDIRSFDIDTYGEKEAEKKAYDYIKDSIKYWKGELNEDDFNVRKSNNGNKGSWVVMRQFPKFADGGDIQDEIAYLNNRISNLKRMVVVLNDDEKPQMYQTIKSLENERNNLLNKGMSFADGGMAGEWNIGDKFRVLKGIYGDYNSPRYANKEFEVINIRDGKYIDARTPTGTTETFDIKNIEKIKFSDGGNVASDEMYKEVYDYAIGGNRPTSMESLKKQVDSFAKRENVSVRQLYKDIEEIRESNEDYHYYSDGGSMYAKGGEAKNKKGDNYDVYDNKRMLQNQANEIEHHSEELNNQVKVTKRVPAWVVSKMERATTDLSDITHYLDGENKMSHGGDVGKKKTEIIPLPSSKKFVIVEMTYNDASDSMDKNVIRDFNGDYLKFDDINSAQKFIDNKIERYPYGMPKGNLGLLVASQLLQQQQQQPQVVYYVPQETKETGIVQDIPKAEGGGDLDSYINDFCITNLIELANSLQPIKYFVAHKFIPSDFEYKHYKGRLVLVFKEPASVGVIEAINRFITEAEDCHDIFEQSVNVSGDKPNSVSINLLTDRFSDMEFKNGGKVYENTPKKINLSKTKKIKTNLGDYNLALITDDFVYYANEEESDENAQTIMYNKKGELVSDNYFATSDLFDNLLSNTNFEYISPSMEYNRQEILKQNID